MECTDSSAADFKSSHANLLVKDSIVNKTIQVRPGNQSKVFVISVPNDAVDVRLLGSYSTKGWQCAGSAL